MLLKGSTSETREGLRVRGKKWQNRVQKMPLGLAAMVHGPVRLCCTQLIYPIARQLLKGWRKEGHTGF